MHSEASSFLHGSLPDIFGTLGVLLWALRLGSQALSYKRRGAVLDARGVFGRRVGALACFACWLAWGICAIISISAALRDERKFDVTAFIQPHVSVLALVVLVWQICVYELRSRRLSAWFASVGLVCFVVALETLCVRLLTGHGGGGGGTGGAALPYPVTAVVAVGGLILGYWPLYVEMMRHQGRGVTVATILTLRAPPVQVSRTNPTRLAIAVHASALILETGLLLSHVVWKFRTRRERAVAAVLDLTLDELATEHAKAGQPFQYATSRKTVTSTTNTPLSCSPSSSSRATSAGGEGAREREVREWVELRTPARAARMA
ncbi:hypothetical protein F4809DRAFT_636767 [Biscogniauxia mediterranea]|nr:hypothetical protein F4809DRAFT_636767 [Biscogniauxia mediterranea]